MSDPILSGLFGLGISGINYLSQQQTNRQNAQMQQRQQQHNIALWQMNNEYNDPINQMRRLERAGLNPNLIYGQNAGGASGISSSPAQQAPLIPQQAPTIDPSSAKIFSEISQNLANKDKTEEETTLIQETIKGTQFENQVKEFDALLKGIFKSVVNSRKDMLTSNLQEEMETQLTTMAVQRGATKITNEMLSVLSEKFIEYKLTDITYYDEKEQKEKTRKEYVTTFTPQFYEVADKIFETKLNDVELKHIRSGLELFYLNEEDKDKSFWYNAEKITQEVMNTLNELAQTNAEIEQNLLNGKLTSETFFKALLIVLSKGLDAVPSVLNNVTKPSQKSTYQTTNNVYMPKGN